jgi:hypothetical protein
MGKYYISGAISKLPVDQWMFNFKYAKKLLLDNGVETITPLDLNPAGEKEQSWQFYMKRDLKAIFDCNGLILLDNWKKSKGAKIERLICKKLGIPVFKLKDVISGKAKLIDKF